ncbi:Trypsin-like peptidase domain-containing protein [Actinokineospora terrae]|uniref:Trypsin-like peptidase domain-containing protein n=2 Tax=Actinokineospora terrae TaxID=155974 RepID=A0A1H9XPF2_9PSEU|nr:Trypsin-like peptidase domain-containing protein [Actinokineospora terrae]
MVLTCAHVVSAAAGTAEQTAPEQPIRLTFDAMRGEPEATAVVLPDCWAPQRADGSADIALLRLTSPPPTNVSAMLLRLGVPRNREVRAYGYPRQHPDGVWGAAVLAGSTGPHGEWVQLDARVPGQLVRRGFSGAAVIDEETDAVVGMVVTAHTDDGEGLACMVPVRTLVRYVPAIAEWVGSEPIAPRIVVFGGPRPPATDLTRVELDAARTPVEQLGEQLRDDVSRARSGPTGESTPVRVAITNVDRAERPDAVLHQIVKPLAESAEVELHFSDDHSPGLDQARQWLDEEIAARTAVLAERVDALERTEQALLRRLTQIGSVVGPLPLIRLAARDLRLRLRVLDDAVPGVDAARVRTALASTERKAERAELAATAAAAEVEALQTRYREAKDLLRAYHALAVDHELLEDERLSAFHRPAAGAMAARPCQIDAAEPLVSAYVVAVRRQIHGR